MKCGKFTLIELFVTCVILAILAIIVLGVVVFFGYGCSRKAIAQHMEITIDKKVELKEWAKKDRKVKALYDEAMSDNKVTNDEYLFIKPEIERAKVK